MTQPPGPYGAPYGRPAPQGQPGPFGGPAPQGQPGPYSGPAPQGQIGPFGGPAPHGPSGAYGPPVQPPPSPKRNLLPWLIVGGAVLLSGLGIALVLLLTGGDPGNENRAAAASSPSAPATSSSAEPSREPSPGDLPGGAQVAEQTAVAANAFPGSDEVALTWVDALADGNWQTAFDLSCAEVQDAAIAAAAGGDPAYELGRYFYTQVLGGVGFTGGTFDSIEHDHVTGADVGRFSLAMETGETFTLLVYVTDDLTVCDFF